MNSFRNLAIPLLSLAVALVIIGGAAYAYEKEVAKSHEADQLISSVQDRFRAKTAEERRQADLAQIRTSLQIASARLAQLRATFSPVVAIDDAYASFAKSAASLTAAAAKISGKVAPKIAAAEQDLADTLQAWKILLSSIPASGLTPSQIAQAEKYAQQAQKDIDQIKAIADTITPSDSGLTQGQIDTYKQIVDASSGAADKTTGDLIIALPPPPASDTGNTGSNTDTTVTPPSDTTLSNTGSPTSSTTDQTANQGGTNGSPTAADIAAQQQIVDQLRQQIDQLQQQASSTPQDSGTTAPPGTLDNTPPPAIQYDIYGRPKLIQGSNSDVFHQ